MIKVIKHISFLNNSLNLNIKYYNDLRNSYLFKEKQITERRNTENYYNDEDKQITAIILIKVGEYIYLYNISVGYNKF